MTYIREKAPITANKHSKHPTCLLLILGAISVLNSNYVAFEFRGVFKGLN